LKKDTGPEIETAKEKKGFIGSLFQSKSKKSKIESAFDRLNKTNVDTIREKRDNILHFTVDRDKVIEHFVQENASYYTEIEKITGYEPFDKSSENLPTDVVEAVKSFPLDTTNLNVDLRQYQEFGAKYALHHKRTLLGDEMGLGKTIQALAMINHLSQNNQKHAMVVCPLRVVANWKRKIKNSYNVKRFIFHSTNRDTQFEKWQTESGVLITTYEQTLRMDIDKEHQIDTLIVDEAHYIKNTEAKRSQSVYRLAVMSE